MLSKSKKNKILLQDYNKIEWQQKPHRKILSFEYGPKLLKVPDPTESIKNHMYWDIEEYIMEYTIRDTRRALRDYRDNVMDQYICESEPYIE